MTLPLSTVVDISTDIAAGGALRKDFGRGLVITTDDDIPAGGSKKLDVYGTIADVGKVFPSDGDAYKAAAVWFGADPRPRPLYIGRWADADVASELRGGTASSTIGDLQATDGSLRINGTDVTGIDTNSDSDLAAVAATLQGDLRTALGDNGLTVAAASGKLTITLSDAGEITPAEAHSSGTGTDLSAHLGLTADAGAVAFRGHDEETLGEAIAEMEPLMTGGIAVLPAIDDGCPTAVSGDDTRDALLDYAQAGDYFTAVRDTDASAVDPTDTTGLAYRVGNGSYSQAECFYTKAGEYPDIGALALLSAQRLDLAGVRHHSAHQDAAWCSGYQRHVTSSELEALVAKRCNVYSTLGSLPSLIGGYSGEAGSWADAVYWLLWLKNKVEIDIYNGMRAARTIQSRATAGYSHRGHGGRGAEWVEPSQVDPSMPTPKTAIRETTRNYDFDGVLTNGYLTWIEQPSAQSDTDRENRDRSDSRPGSCRGPPFTKSSAISYSAGRRLSCIYFLMHIPRSF